MRLMKKKQTQTPIVVSACLAGINCRYDGSNQLNSRVLNLIKDNKAIALCPEQLGGFPTPRPPAEITSNRVEEVNGRDVTAKYNKGANEALKLVKLHGCKKAILKSKSPMCGSCKIYDGTFSGKLKNGNGIFAQLLKNEGIIIEEASGNQK